MYNDIHDTLYYCVSNLHNIINPARIKMTRVFRTMTKRLSD